MAEKRTITVEKVGDYGVYAGGNWLGISDDAGVKPGAFQKGETCEVVGFRTKSGKFYIKNKIENGAVQTSEVRSMQTSSPVQKMSFDSPEKNERILRQGSYQAVVQSPAFAALVVKEEDFIPTAERLAEALIKKIKGEE